jgi:hypothetical protein
MKKLVIACAAYFCTYSKKQRQIFYIDTKQYVREESSLSEVFSPGKLKR